MRKEGFSILLLFLLLIPWQGMGQDQTNELLNRVLNRLDQIQSFEADALIKVDVEFIDIKDRLVRIKFTAPDQFEFDSKGLALLPKNGIQMEYLSLIRAAYTAIPAGTESIREVDTEIIKIIPESIESDIILAQFWVNPITAQLLRMKTFTRSSGSYTIDFLFPDEQALLPGRLDVAFEIENMSFLPGGMMNELMKEGTLTVDSIPKQAKVSVEYQNLTITKK